MFCDIFFLLGTKRIQGSHNFMRLNLMNCYTEQFNIGMKKLKDPIDSNILIRLLNLHYFLHIFRTFTLQNAAQGFSRPRFDLFRKLKKFYEAKDSHSLYWNILLTFRSQIIIGGIVTIIAASLNLLVPQLIRSFVEFINSKNLTKEEIRQADQFLYKFILIQTLRLFFAEHAKRLFHQLAIRVESTLARKLVQKSLRISRECRDRIPQSEIIHLQNVDLKLIFTLFKNMYLLFEVPFTITVAIIMLFLQSRRYGFIAIYWFVIAFLLQRQLDGKMTHCNKTKLKLIESRSGINYELLQKMKEAKVIGYQDLIVQKNNDLFIEENHDHRLFYRYSTLYDITLLMLPILMVVTITLYDINEQYPVTVEQVYSLLALLGICYMPMKSTRTISISMHDGLLSLERLSHYFQLSEEIKSELIESQHQIGQIMIRNDTIATYPHSNYVFQIRCKFHIEIHKGQRLNVISRMSHGSTSFLQMLVGELKKIKGNVFINGKISYKPEKIFFTKQTVEENIRFYNKQISSAQIKKIYELFGLDKDLKQTEGLNMVIDDTNKFTVSTLQKIALARSFVADADIYILDSPYSNMDPSTAIVVEQLLREKQQQGKTIVTALKFLEFIQPQDRIIILNQGTTEEYGSFEQLTQNTHSKISKYFKSREDESAFSQTGSQMVVQRFKNKAKNMAKQLSSKKSIIEARKQSVPKLLMQQPFLKSASILNKNLKSQREAEQADANFMKYIKKFFKAVSFLQIIYILVIILSAELLHIFIHFFIGHLSEDHGDEGYQDYRNMLILQVVLTFCLSAIIYLEGEVSSYLAIIIGNKLYQQSLKQLTAKRITWFAKEYSVKIADRFNHDYEQIFIAVHGLLGIYKNIIIFIATIQFIHTNRKNIFIIMTFLVIVYFLVFKLIREVQKKVIKYYYDYKYSYVRVLEESIRGATIYNILGVKNQIMNRTEEKYQRLAAYKLAESYTPFAISILTDVIGIILLASAISYGIEMKENQLQSRHIAVIATSLALLVNLSDVLKIIFKQSLNFGTFFSINIMPFLEIQDIDTQYKKKSNPIPQVEDKKTHLLTLTPSSFEISFQSIVLREPSYVGLQTYPLTFTLMQGQRVLLYQTNDLSRNLLLYSLTRNLPMLTEPQLFGKNQETIKIGNQDIRQIQPTKLRKMISVIMQMNFYFSGTIKENISLGGKLDQAEAKEYINLLGLNMDLQDYDENGLETKLNFEDNQLNPSITKKIALLRILLQKPQIIILKDITSFIQSISIIEMIDIHYPFKPTIIKINNSIESSFDVNRIIYMENLEIKEDGSRKSLLENQHSQLGQMLKDVNLEGYLYTRRADSITGRMKKKSAFTNANTFTSNRKNK